MDTKIVLDYESVAQRLNLDPKNENEDKITVLLCNNIVNSILAGSNSELPELQLLENLVLKVFLKVKEMERLKSFSENEQHNLSETELLELFDAVQETVKFV